jgi:hypothetical protein
MTLLLKALTLEHQPQIDSTVPTAAGRFTDKKMWSSFKIYKQEN